MSIKRKLRDRGTTLFVVVALGAWAGGIWFPAVGPAIWGVYWLPFLILDLIVSLFLVGSMPSTPRDTTVQLAKSCEKEPETGKRIVLGAYTLRPGSDSVYSFGL